MHNDVHMLALDVSDIKEDCGPSGADVLGRRVADWSKGVVQRTDTLAVVHVERPALLHAKIRGVVSAGPLPDLVQAWAVR